MRLRVVFAVAVALCLVGQPAFAQLEFGGGAKGGIGFSKMSFVDTADLPTSLDGQRIGVVIGAFVMIPVNERFVIQPEVLFVQKGSTGTSDGLDLTFELDYLEIPILMNVRFPTGGSMAPFVFTGPVPAINTAANLVVEEDEADFSDNFKTLDFLWTVGGGLQYENLTIEGRYTFGFGPANEETLVDRKNRTFAILFGIILG